MKKVNMSKLLKVLQKVDHKIHINHGVVIHEAEGPLFYLVNEAQEQEFIDYVENPKNCFNFNKRVLFMYLRQFKYEFIYIIHTKEEIKEVIVNKLHLEINDEGYIRYEHNEGGHIYKLINFDKFVLTFNEKSAFTHNVNDLLATIVRRELEGYDNN